MAIFIALNVILSRFCSVHIPFEGVEGIRIGFGTLPLVLSGILLGARLGFLAGLIGTISRVIPVAHSGMKPPIRIPAGIRIGGLSFYDEYKSLLG